MLEACELTAEGAAVCVGGACVVLEKLDDVEDFGLFGLGRPELFGLGRPELFALGRPELSGLFGLSLSLASSRRTRAGTIWIGVGLQLW